jgi:hypothetical protein
METSREYVQMMKPVEHIGEPETEAISGMKGVADHENALSHWFAHFLTNAVDKLSDGEDAGSSGKK